MKPKPPLKRNPKPKEAKNESRCTGGGTLKSIYIIDTLEVLEYIKILKGNNKD